MTSPEFLCMGFQKCGTTTLFEILRQHRGVVLCRDVKEPMYYRVKGLRAIGGKRYYELRYFGHVSPDDPRMPGEVNAGLTFTGCAEKICRDFAPDTKLIFMLRNPVDRCYSAYKYFLARGFLPAATVEDDRRNGHAAAFHRYVHSVLDSPEKRGQIMRHRLKYLVFSQSNYATCIREFLGPFPRENLHLIFFEEFIRDQHAACRELYRFLGLDDDGSIHYAVRANEGSERPTSAWRAKRTQYVKGWNFGLYEFLGMSHWAPGLYRAFRRHYEAVRAKGMEPDTDHSKLRPDTRAYLQDYFRQQVRGVEEIAGRDLRTLWYD